MSRCRLARTIRRSRSTRCELARLGENGVRLRWIQNGFPAAHRHRRDTTQPDGFQGRYQQSANAGPRGHAPFRLGGRRGAGLDARRQLCRRTPHRYRAAALGPNRPRSVRSRRSGGKSGPAHRWAGNMSSTRSTSMRPTPAATRWCRRIRTCGWRTPRPTAMRRSFADPIHTTTACFPRSIAAGTWSTTRAVLHLLSARPAHGLRQNLRQALQARCDEPVRHPCRQRHVRLPAWRDEWASSSATSYFES